jgi:predicted NBD/HSP70 family sugar kinase
VTHQNAQPVYLGMDVGGTNVKYGLVDSAGAIMWGARVATPVQRPLPVEAIVDIAAGALDRATQSGHVVLGIGVASPGRVDPSTGVVLAASNLQWNETALGHGLERKVGLPVRVLNDTNAAALGEFGVLRQPDPSTSLMYISLGTGVGAGLILNGALYSGPHFAAGELGHVIADPFGRPCVCGGTGCLETIAAGPAIVREFSDRLAAKSGSTADGNAAAPTALTLSDVVAAARDGNSAASAALSASTTALGIQVANCCNLLDISLFLIGGGVANIHWPMVSEIGRTATALVMPSKRARLQVRKSRMIDRAAIVGAVMDLRENVHI